MSNATSNDPRAVAPASQSPEPARLISRRLVLERTCLSRTELWRRIKSGRFPEPVRLGPQKVAWLEASVSQWIESVTAASEPHGRA